MADIQHADIPDAQRHEPKGITSATAGTVYVADGADSGAWEKLGVQSLDGISTNGTDGQTIQSAGDGTVEFGKLFTTYSPTLSPASVGANTTAEETFTVTGLLTTDALLAVIKPTAQAGLGIVGFRISAADTLAITFANVTGSPIVPTASQVYKVHIWR